MPDWHPHLDVWLLLGGVWVAYMVAVRTHARTAPPGDHEERGRRSALFSTGMALLLVASDWPVHDLAEGYLYSAHMVQHLVYTLVAAPLLVVGIPAWMWRLVLRVRPLGAAFGFFTRPVVAIATCNGRPCRHRGRRSTCSFSRSPRRSLRRFSRSAGRRSIPCTRRFRASGASRRSPISSSPG